MTTENPEKTPEVLAAEQAANDAQHAAEAEVAKGDLTPEQKALADSQTSTHKTPEELAAAEAGNAAQQALTEGAGKDPLDPNAPVDGPEAAQAEFAEEPEAPVNQAALRGIAAGPTHHPRTHVKHPLYGRH